MKLLANPISSPSRADKFPPPVLRFMRSNGGSKSRGRSRSSPIFIRKKTETITPEPSSPKVTCMGQVRAKTVPKTKKKKKKNNNNNNNKRRKNPFSWMKNALFCRVCDNSSVWRRWGRRKMEEIKKEDITESVHEEEEEKFAVVVSVRETPPPKNALLLMRCRSEPYRASSLANQFWGSPEEDHKKEETPTLKEDPICRDSVHESRIDQETEEKLGFCQGIESSTRTSTKVSARNEEDTLHDVGPVFLTRCKSEPAGTRRLGKFEVETSFWKKRLEFD